MRQPSVCCLLLSLVAACHSEPFTYNTPDVGPAGAGSDVLLTFNDVNYWPTLTEDGSGVLYAFTDESEPPVRPVTYSEMPLFGPDTLHIHRCMGEIPVQGGTRRWEFCDNRPAQIDSLNSFSAFAMGADGRLIYAESVSPRRFPFDTARVSIWLADSATPFRRTELVRFPITLGDSVINWIADLKWTGPASFTALGQRAVLFVHCASCSSIDSVFYGEYVLRGTITGGTASLAVVAGTAGTTAYAITDSGASILFAQVNNSNLLKVPLAGGTAVVVATGIAPPGGQVFGLSCSGSKCVVGTGFLPDAGGGPFELRSIVLGTGAVVTLFSSGQPLSMPLLTSTGDVVAQLGPMYGRMRTFQAKTLGLHLYRGLLP
jgi:hypothetical protein